jgi:hypothetical protein
MKVKIWLRVAVASAFAASAFAQAPGGGPPGGGPPPEMRAIFDAVNKACAEDRKTTCGGQEGREGMMCLRANQDKLSAGCKDAMSKLPQRPPGGGGPPRN